MGQRYCILFCIILVADNAYGFVQRDVTEAPKSDILESVQRNTNRIRECLDQSLATAVRDVDEKQLQPVFNALGEQVNRFSKAFDILTAPQSTSSAK